MILTARKFSAYGPCVPVGQVVRETRTQLVLRNANTGAERRVRKTSDVIHTEPCVSCRDHPATQYPNGYEN